MAFYDPSSDEGSSVLSGGKAGFRSSAAGLAAEEGMSLLNAGVQYFNQKKLNRQAQKMTQENMRLQKELNLEQQYQSIANSTSAYKAAGLNPALAAGAPVAAGVSMAAGNAGSAGMPPTPDVAALLGAGAQLDMLATQKENVKENTELQKEQAREKKIQNDRKESEDYFYTEHFPAFVAHLEKMTDDEFTQGWLDSVREESKGLLHDKGIVDAFNNIFFEMTRQERYKALDELTNEMDVTVMRMQLNNGTAAALADLPKANRKLIYKNMLKMDAEIARLRAETRNINEDTSFFKERREQTAATVAKLGQETLSILHNDKVALYDAGEIGALSLTLGFDAVDQFAHGAGFGTGLAVAGKLTGGAKFAPPRLETIKKAKDVGMPKETYQEIVRRADAFSKGDPVKRAQMINKGVDYWNKHKNDSKYK